MSVGGERDGSVLVLTLDRPERLNALTVEDYEALARHWRDAASDDTVRAIVLTGAGDRAFSTGADLYDTIPHPVRLIDLFKAMGEARPDRGLPLYKPVIAAVRGFCIGGGMTLMLHTDLRIASEDAVFSLPEVRWGIPVNVAPALLGPAALAAEWAMLGETFDAATALRHGLINRIVPADDVLDRAIEMARRAAEAPHLATSAIKELALRTRHMSAPDAERLEESLARLVAAGSS